MARSSPVSDHLLTESNRTATVLSFPHHSDHEAFETSGNHPSGNPKRVWMTGRVDMQGAATARKLYPVWYWARLPYEGDILRVHDVYVVDGSEDTEVGVQQLAYLGQVVRARPLVVDVQRAVVSLQRPCAIGQVADITSR